MQVKVRIQDWNRLQTHGAIERVPHLPVTQVHPMGCAVACVAFVLNRSYEETRKLFDFPDRAWSEGFLCADVTTALARAGKPHTTRTQLDPVSTQEGITRAPSIVFIGPSEQHPMGHYLAWSPDEQKWMDPWINFPDMTPAESGFRNQLPGEPLYWFYPVKASRPQILR